MNFKPDPQSAAKSVSLGGAYITEKCMLVCTIIRAWDFTSGSGSQALQLNLKAHSGQDTDQSIWYYSGNSGENLRGYELVSRLCLLLGIHDLPMKPTKMEMMDWNDATRTREKVERIVPTAYPALMKKTIGVVFRVRHALGKNQETGAYDMPLFSKNTGEPILNPEIVEFYDAATGLSYNEIQRGETEPKEIKALFDKIPPPKILPLPGQAASATTAAPAGAGGFTPSPMPSMDDFDDAIPF